MIEKIQEEINAQLAEAEDEIIKNRIEHMVNKAGFSSRFISRFSITEHSSDNIQQELIDFLMDEMDVNG